MKNHPKNTASSLSLSTNVTTRVSDTKAIPNCFSAKPDGRIE